MSEPINVAVGFPVRDDIIARIESVDSRIRVIHLPALAGARYEHTQPPEADRNAWKAELARAHVLFGPTSIAREYLDAAHNLRWLQVINAGVDRLASDGILQRGFTVTNVSGLTAVAIAEWVLGAMLMFEKGMHLAVRNQLDHRWGGWRVGELDGKTCGIVGMGAIGREVAKRARAFGMRIVASRRTVEPGATDPDCDELVTHADLAPLFAASDYVVLCVPLTPETRHMIGAAALAAMKPTARLVNIARGPVVDQEALIAALNDGTIAGAALDVTDPEPLPAESPLWDIPNVILTPHVSGSIEGYGHRAAELFLANLGRYVSGQPLHNVVSPELGY